MGKRGPKATGRTGVILSTRIDAELRSRLDAASTASGLTLSREVQRRLERSFGDDNDIQERFGGKRAYAFVRALGAVFSPVGETAFSLKHLQHGKDGAWLNDPYAYDQAAKAVVAVLESMRPSGDIEAPNHFEVAPEGMESTFAVIRSALPLLGASVARNAMSDIANAAEEGAKGVSTKKPSNVTRRIAEDLGDVARRAKKRVKP